MKTFKQLINEMPGEKDRNAGPSSPVKHYKDNNTILPYFGWGRVNNVRPKGGKTIADLIKGV